MGNGVLQAGWNMGQGQGWRRPVWPSLCPSSVPQPLAVTALYLVAVPKLKRDSKDAGKNQETLVFLLEYLGPNATTPALGKANCEVICQTHSII